MKKKMVKVFTIIVLLFSIVGLNAQPGWQQQTSGVAFWLNSVHFTDANTGFIIGDVGATILKTTNGGTNWIPQASGITTYLESLYFTDANTGYAVGGLGTIIKTTNAGTTWTQQTSGTTEPLYCVYFVNANIGYASTWNGKIIKTTNGGTTWSIQASGIMQYINSIYFTDANTGYATGMDNYNGEILKTIDGGINWSNQLDSGYATVNSICFTDANTGYATTSGNPNKILLKTTDGGTNWIPQVISTTPYWFGSVYFFNANIGYILRNDGLILKTIDGGINWIEHSINTLDNLSSVYFTDANTGYVVGQNGRIDKTISGGNCMSTPVITAGSDTSICFNSGTILTASSNLANTTYHWNNGINDSINTVNPATTTTYTVTATNNTCTAVDSVIVNVQNVFQNEEICIVTVDTTTWKNKIIWEKTPNVAKASFNIYKETGTNIYDSIGNVPYSNQSFFIDVSSNPQLYANRYKISAIDSCGEESQKSFYHQVVKLIITSQVGSSTVDLDWSLYEDESGIYVPTRYYIYKGSSANSMVLIDSVPGTQHMYSDINVTGFYYYMIGVKKDNGCNVTKSIFGRSFSNNITNSNTGINSYLKDTDVNIYPNPVTNELIIEFNGNTKNTNFEILNSIGQVVFKGNLIEKTVVQTSNFAPGIYLLKLENGKTFEFKKIIKE
jgi:photosystem II stability/assembly factor-like uncharacterized protein